MLEPKGQDRHHYGSLDCDDCRARAAKAEGGEGQRNSALELSAERSLPSQPSARGHAEYFRGMDGPIAVVARLKG